MLAWFFTGIWHMLFGFVLLVTFFIGSVIVLAKAIAQGAAHDQASCDCWDCKNRRHRAVDRRKSSTNRPRKMWDQEKTSKWRSTEELTTGFRVVSKTGVCYEVTSIKVTRVGMLVSLTVMSSGRKSEVFISQERVKDKVWKPAPDWQQG